jgi:hypothetical protein
MLELMSEGSYFRELLGPYYSYIGLLPVLCMVHLFYYRRGFIWVPIILILPLIGCLIYFFVEVIPLMRRPRVKGFWDSVMPISWRIEKLKTKLAESATLENRLELARAYLEAKQAKQACEIAAGALEGVFCHDAETQIEVAYFYLEAGEYDEVLRRLQLVKKDLNRQLAVKVKLYQGRAKFELKRFGEAEFDFREAMKDWIGEEVRYYLAMSLILSGNSQEGELLLTELVKKYKKNMRHWRKTEKEWYVGACRELKNLQKKRGVKSC